MEYQIILGVCIIHYHFNIHIGSELVEVSGEEP
jgi:hypothetical protein